MTEVIIHHLVAMSSSGNVASSSGVNNKVTETGSGDRLLTWAKNNVSTSHLLFGHHVTVRNMALCHAQWCCHIMLAALGHAVFIVGSGWLSCMVVGDGYW